MKTLTYIIFSFIAVLFLNFSANAQKAGKNVDVPYQECHPGDSSINTAIIYFYRPATGASKDLNIYLDNESVTALKPGSYYELRTTKKGPVRLSTDFGDQLAFNVSYGRVYYVETEMRGKKSKMKVVEPEKGYSNISYIKSPEQQVQATPF